MRVGPKSSGGEPRRALVTGATGLLGANLVRELLNGGGEVVAVVRTLERACDLLPDHGRLRVVRGDVLDLEPWREELRGLDAIFHTAAYFREYYQPGADLDLLHRTNVVALENLMPAAQAAGVPVVVHISSIGALGRPPQRGGWVDEDTPPGADWESNAYRASKVRSEAAARRFCEGNRLRVPIVLPGWMWGPGDAGPTSAGRLFLMAARGELRAVPRAGNNVVDARDVAAACVRAAQFGISGRRYIVAGEWVSLAELTGLIATLAGVTRPRELPAVLAPVMASILEFQARLRGRPPVVTKAGIRVLLEGKDRRVSSKRAERELGVTFRPFRETLADEAAWYLKRGELASIHPINETTRGE